jgi:peroxiredoxin Q/BCP
VSFVGTFLRRLFASRAESELLPVGSAAPAFAVPDHTGRTVRLEDLRGRRVLLWFFPKASTPG